MKSMHLGVVLVQEVSSTYFGLITNNLMEKFKITMEADPMQIASLFQHPQNVPEIVPSDNIRYKTIKKTISRLYFYYCWY